MPVSDILPRHDHNFTATSLQHLTQFYHQISRSFVTGNSELFFIKGVKSVLIRTFSGPYFPTFGLNTERQSVSLCIQSEYGKMRIRKTPNTNTFHAVSKAAIREQGRVSLGGIVQTAVGPRLDLTNQPRYVAPGDFHVGQFSAMINVGLASLSS